MNFDGSSLSIGDTIVSEGDVIYIPCFESDFETNFSISFSISFVIASTNLSTNVL